MHASVRRYRATDAEALIKRVQEEFVERVKTVEGFRRLLRH
jgi:sugar-specific transcriptional regulator TrmB